MHSQRAIIALTSAALFFTLSGCGSTKTSIVNTPTLPPPSPAPVSVNTQGSIYQASMAMSLYETPHAKQIGDVLTIRLSESYTGSNTTNAQASRASDITAEAADKSTSASARLARLFNIGSGSTTFKGQGSIADTNGMTGTLAVLVIGTMPTGNLLVSGEKIISMGGNRDTLRFSGIVNPKDIEAGNFVTSSKVANARIEQAGEGMLADSTTLGWLQHLFMSVLTF
ncbi:flagellar basal body L-ring protein FlgH [Paraburkholderia terrae]|uniref:flagellar basal body L-ring protein FlgH n=1 Tax=Paraburkholderia terrae TaxID=311230 RepID=UPI003365A8C5